MNSRGQAFSVFQLLIAAIIAVAILGVLFGIMGQVGISNLGDPKTEIANALSAVKSGGETTTKAFGMNGGDRIRSIDFEKDGFAGDEIIFYVDETELPYASDTGFYADFGGADDDYSVASYGGSNPRSLEAKVICLSTGERLADEMDDAYPDAISEADGGLCMADPSVSPCCAVVLRRSS